MITPRQTFASFLLFSLLLPVCSRGDTTTDAIARATAAVQAAVPQAQSDPAHPIFHVTAPAQWVNDPNGPLFHQGYYHLFYQLHPFSDQSGPKYWGHVRSRDLVKWEHLPIAVCPSPEAGESEVWSGCCTINGLGEPMIFYTSIAPGKPAQTHAEQWAAIGDKDLITWHKSPANPVLSEALHGATKIYEWRDPFIFNDHKRTFLVTGGNLNNTKGGQATVNIYEAKNPALTEWQYRGVLYQLPDPAARTAECPNFFKLENEWVLFVSPYGKVQYFLGAFDAATCRFQARTNGLLDYGPNFYAPNTMQVPDGRRIVWGWVNGFQSGHGWNGCLSLPRLLSLSRDGELRQSPAPQLTKLRGKGVTWKSTSLEAGGYSWVLPATNTLEISADIQLQTATGITLDLKTRTSAEPRITLNFSGSEIKLGDSRAPLDLGKDKRTLRLRIFVDRSVLEVFANDTVCFTKTIPVFEGVPRLEIHAEGGTASAKLVQAWPMGTIW